MFRQDIQHKAKDTDKCKKRIAKAGRKTKIFEGCLMSPKFLAVKLVLSHFFRLFLFFAVFKEVDVSYLMTMAAVLLPDYCVRQKITFNICA